MRIAPITPPYSAEVQAQFDQLPPSWQPPFEHFKILARDPRLLRAYRHGSVAYLEPSHLKIRQREVFLLRVTGRCRDAFEWCLRAHYFADDAGITETQLHASVQCNAGDACWEAGDRVLIHLADELHDTVSISDGLWSELRDAFFRTGDPPTAFAGRPLSDKCICVGWPAGAGRSEGQAAVSRGVSERFKPC
jgi:hypothetical protein